MKRLLNLGLLVGIMCISASPVHAQSIKKNALEKTNWYTTPREFQIIDDRPVIRDFREAPAAGNDTIQLPPGPAASGGGGGGGGAMGQSSSLPGGGMQLGGPNQGFRSAPSGMGSLPKSGFGGSNIPAGGFAPKGLQNVKQGVMGNMAGQGNRGVGAGAPSGMAPSTGRSVGNSSGPAVQSYSGGYGQGSGSSYGGSSSRTESMVRGTLLKSK